MVGKLRDLSATCSSHHTSDFTSSKKHLPLGKKKRPSRNSSSWEFSNRTTSLQQLIISSHHHSGCRAETWNDLQRVVKADECVIYHFWLTKPWHRTESQGRNATHPKCWKIQSYKMQTKKNKSNCFNPKCITPCKWLGDCNMTELDLCIICLLALILRRVIHR